MKRHLLRGSLLGLLILGIGGRLLMRVVAHREGRVPAFTTEGTLTVIFAGTIAGLFAGLIYALLHRFVRRQWWRTLVFVAICEVIAWRGVHGLLPVPQMMFMALALVYLIIIDVMGRRQSALSPDNPRGVNDPVITGTR